MKTILTDIILPFITITIGLFLLFFTAKHETNTGAVYFISIGGCWFLIFRPTIKYWIKF